MFNGATHNKGDRTLNRHLMQGNKTPATRMSYIFLNFWPMLSHRIPSIMGYCHYSCLPLRICQEDLMLNIPYTWDTNMERSSWYSSEKLHPYWLVFVGAGWCYAHFWRSHVLLNPIQLWTLQTTTMPGLTKMTTGPTVAWMLYATVD